MYSFIGVNFGNLESRNSTIEQRPSWVLGKTTCSTCGQSFASVEDQRDHYKSDRHVENLRRKLEGLEPIALEDDSPLVQDEEDSDYSSSDSASSDEDIGPSTYSLHDWADDGIGKSYAQLVGEDSSAVNSIVVHAISRR